VREAILEGKEKYVVRDAPEPVLGEGELLIRVQYCGICGSDLHTYYEGANIRHGHEFSGDIVEIGSGVKGGWQIGDRVTAESHSYCGECFWCKQGETRLCEDLYLEWAQTPGAFATFTKAKYNKLHKLPPGLGYEEAVLVEPTAVALHAVNMSGTGIGDTVAVLGLGPIGHLVARLVKVSGAGAIYATETNRSRIELATDIADKVIDASAVDPVERILELTGGKGPDVVIECAGAATTTQQSLAMVRKGGTVLLAGVYLHQVETLISSIVLRELTVKGAVFFSSSEFATALNLINDKKIDVTPLITHVMPLDEIDEAFKLAAVGEGGKILLKP
jgi:2-desacetyl-2-hydroxyethyl bacteriochlorophyllide A dehydrogenase